MFLLKKIIAPLLFPLPLCLEIIIIGLFLLWFTRKQKAGKILTSIGVVILIFLSYNVVSSSILRPLERQYPPLLLSATPDAPAHNSTPLVKWIVVLGGGHTSDPQIPSISQLYDASLARLVYAVSLYRELPGCKLIVSGGAVFDPNSEAENMAKAARALGVSQQDIVLEADSKDTEDEANLIKPMVGSERFILVTSASHMPRSMALFTKLGMNPVPAPTDYMVKQNNRIGPGDFYPSPEGLSKAERAVYEYLGLAWARLRGKI